ncbi:MAG: chloride channel protein [Bacteroidales bacterium]|nr:chloride channel protein [Bacteroidales bacterium]
MKYPKIIGKFIYWRLKNIKERQFVLILSFVVGLISGLAAIVLKNTIYYTHYFLTKGFHVEYENYLYLAYPFFGILLTVFFIRTFIKHNIGHGVSRILFSISKQNSIIKQHNTYSSILASTLTIGFGGSVGSEAPIVLTGASIGSNLGRLFRMNYKTTTLLIGCGAAGAIAGIFKAPIAGLVFTLEVLMLDLTMASLVPLLISAVTGASIAYFLMGNEVLLSYNVTTSFLINDIPFYILLGIFAGLVSLYFTRGAMFIESKFSLITKAYKKLIVGGISLSLLIFVFPPLYGEGYEILKEILSGNGLEIVNNSFFYSIKDNYWLFLSFLLLILIFKVAAMSVTTGSGGIGGIFAPTLFMGGISGYFVALLLNRSSYINVSESNFALVGMAGLMAGVMHAPLTGIFLIAEITGGYQLFIPLMITATISYITIIYFEPHTIYTKRLALRGELITHHKDKAVLTLLKMGAVIEKDFKIINQEATLGELVKVVSMSKRNIFPVINDENNFQGIVLLDNIRDIMFNPDMYDDTYVYDLMITPPAIVSSGENMDTVMEKFEETGAWNLPVIDDEKYIGFISKSKIFSAYRKILVHFSDE